MWSVSFSLSVIAMYCLGKMIKERKEEKEKWEQENRDSFSLFNKD